MAAALGLTLKLSLDEYDIRRGGDAHNLAASALQDTILFLISQGKYDVVVATTPCSPGRGYVLLIGAVELWFGCPGRASIGVSAFGGTRARG